jgi:hypothetical protein
MASVPCCGPAVMTMRVAAPPEIASAMALLLEP